MVLQKDQNQKVYIVVGMILCLAMVSCSWSKTKSDVYYKKGSRAHHNGNFSAAIESYQKSIALDPSNPRVHFDLGIAYLDNRNYAKATQQIRKLEKMDQNLMASLLKDLREEKKSQ